MLFTSHRPDYYNVIEKKKNIEKSKWSAHFLNVFFKLWIKYGERELARSLTFIHCKGLFCAVLMAVCCASRGMPELGWEAWAERQLFFSCEQEVNNLMRTWWWDEACKCAPVFRVPPGSATLTSAALRTLSPFQQDFPGGNAAPGVLGPASGGEKGRHKSSPGY